MIKMARVESEVFVGVGRFIVNIPTPMDSLLSCELSYKLNDHLSPFKASKRRNLLFQGIFFKRSVPFVWLLANIRWTTTLNSNQRLRFLFLLTDHKCLAGGKFGGENNTNVYDKMGALLFLFLKRVRIWRKMAAKREQYGLKGGKFVQDMNNRKRK